jgi:hypothetical protein
MTNAKYGRLTAALIAAWFFVSLTAAALHLFDAAPGRPPIAFGLAVVIPIALYLLWFTTSKEFRRFVLSLDTRTLALVHTLRLAGLSFLALYTFRILPGLFALPAGWGDITVGVTAPLVAMYLANPTHRRSFLLWEALGVVDLVTALTLGTTVRFIEPQAVATNAMTVLPMSLIPTFAVPLFLIIHMISIAQARQWPKTRQAGFARPAESPAA